MKINFHIKMESNIVELIEFLPDHLQEEIWYKINVNLDKYYFGLLLFPEFNAFITKNELQLSFTDILNLLKNQYNNLNIFSKGRQDWNNKFAHDWIIKNKNRIPVDYNYLTSSADSARMVIYQFATKDALDLNHNEIVIMLLANTLDPRNHERIFLLNRAIHRGNVEIVKFLLENGLDPNSIDQFQDNDDPPLIQAAYQGNVEIVKLLLKYGANPNIQNENKNTALIVSGEPEIVKLLLETGADPNIENIDGYTAISYTSGGEHGELIKKILLDHGAIDTGNYY